MHGDEKGVQDTHLQGGTQERLKIADLYTIIGVGGMAFDGDHSIESIQDRQSGFLHSDVAILEGQDQATSVRRESLLPSDYVESFPSTPHTLHFVNSTGCHPV